MSNLKPVTVTVPVLRSGMAVSVTPPWFVNGSEYQPHDGTFKLLINGQDAFGAVHRAIANAKKSVCIICWGFQPSMFFIRDGKSPSIGQLLEQKAEEGVQVRVLCWELALLNQHINATGPTAGESNTPGRWALRIKDKPATSTQAQHDYDIWWYDQYDEEQEWPDELIKDLRAIFGNNKAKNLHFHGRGFSTVDRAKIASKDFDDKGLAGTTEGALSVGPSHHQKMVLVDYEDPNEAIGFVMGHNMLDAYWDTSDHSAYPRSYYHSSTPESRPNTVANGQLPRQDFSSQLTGPMLGDLFNNFAAAWKKATGEGLAKPANDFASYPYRLEDGLTYIKGQILRTQAQYGAEDIKKCYLQAVNNATQYIYIENQYFRWPPLAEKIKAAAQGQGAAGRKPETHGPLYLFAITNSEDEGVGAGPVNTYRMLDALGRADTMPQVARLNNLETLDEQIAKNKKEIKRLERERDALDSEARLYQGLPNTAGQLTQRYQSNSQKLEAAHMRQAELDQQKAALQEDYNKQQEAQKDGAQKDVGGTTIQPEDIPGLKCHICTIVAPDTQEGQNWMEVYIHAKLMLIDDTFMTLGSANINTRSMQVDSELNIAHHRPEITAPARSTLWSNHTGGQSGQEPMGKDGMALAYYAWGRIMEKNKERRDAKSRPLAPLVMFRRLSDSRKNLD